jgi:hypothetical protein
MRHSPAAIERNRVKAREYARNHPQAPEVSREARVRRNLARPFIAWDGEGDTIWRENENPRCLLDGRYIHRYILFGSSAGHEISAPGLSTKSCLNLLLTAEQETPDAFHVWFSAEYDVNMILRDLSWRQLNLLKHTGSCRYAGYKIRHTPRKTFRVSRGGVSITLFDVFGFFHSSYTHALEKFGIGTEAQRARIQEGKDRRGSFTYADLDYIVDYWRAELSLMPPLMDHIREMCYDAGLCITSWHGPGALASYIIRIEKILEWKSNEKTVPAEVKFARACAFAGGWFYSWQCGLWNRPAWTYDINSAYLYAATMMPRLDNGIWVRTKPEEISENYCPLFGLYHLQFEGDKRTGQGSQNVYPLFYRDPKGTLTWPQAVQGWYWGPEARNAIATGRATVLEAWVFQDNGARPFTVVNDYYERRRHLKAAGNPAEKTIKWALAAMYGQYARRVGWDKLHRTAPRSHQLEWAGFITSYCRSMVWKAAEWSAQRGALVSVDTDGVTSTVPIPADVLENGVGTELGQWEVTEYPGIFHWQNGVYWTLTASGEWVSAKARGVPKGRIEAATALAAYARLRTPFIVGGPKMTPDEYGVITTTKTRFTGYREVLASHAWQDWRTWRTDEARIILGGGGKLSHWPAACHKCRNPDADVMHTVVLPPIKPGMSLGLIHHIGKESGYFPVSQPHKLPWTTPHLSDDELNIEEIELDIIGLDDERNDL